MLLCAAAALSGAAPLGAQRAEPRAALEAAISAVIPDWGSSDVHVGLDAAVTLTRWRQLAVLGAGSYSHETGVAASDTRCVLTGPCALLSLRDLATAGLGLRYATTAQDRWGVALDVSPQLYAGRVRTTTRERSSPESGSTTGLLWMGHLSLLSPRRAHGALVGLRYAHVPRAFGTPGQLLGVRIGFRL